jgi:hypothetical protein
MTLSRQHQSPQVTARLPIGVVIRTIGADPAFWLENARRLDDAGYAGVARW